MAYLTSNPPKLLIAPIASVGSSVWTYDSADPAATIDNAGYITNGGALGMKAGDTLFANDTTNNINTIHRVVTVSATYPGVVDLSNGVTVGGGSNTD